MTEDQAILRQAAAWIRGMANAARQVLTHAPEPAKPIPLTHEDDVFVYLAGRPSECNPNPRIVNCFLPQGAEPKGTVTIQDVGDVLGRLAEAADALYRGMGDEGVTPVASELRRIIGPPQR